MAAAEQRELESSLAYQAEERIMRKGRIGLASTIMIASMVAVGVAQDGGAMGPSSMGKSSTTLSASDRWFLKEAAQGGMEEVELGQLARQKASSQDVKNFGQRMVDDHSKANSKLEDLAASKGITLPRA